MPAPGWCLAPGQASPGRPEGRGGQHPPYITPLHLPPFQPSLNSCIMMQKKSTSVPAINCTSDFSVPFFIKALEARLMVCQDGQACTCPPHYRVDSLSLQPLGSTHTLHSIIHCRRSLDTSYISKDLFSSFITTFLHYAFTV